MGLDTKTYWLTDRQSQCDFDFWPRQFAGSFLRECSGVQVGRKLKEPTETRNTAEYKGSACEDLLCEAEDFVCATVQQSWKCNNYV
jgi:hypothetical protein